MAWKKIGLIYEPDVSKWWSVSHAALPVPVQLKDGLFRVFFAGRDERNRSHVGWFELDLADPQQVLAVSKGPVLAPGPLGYFDDHGVYASSVVSDQDILYLYTIGWNPGISPPLFYSSIGLAISDDNGLSFKKLGKAPILARSEFDPCLVTSPFVLKERELWRMWYVSGTGWDILEGKYKSRYHIKYAESADGINWNRKGFICFDNSDEKERNISRACILKRQGMYHAWFSVDRGKGYRIRHAVSKDGKVWQRKGEPRGLEVSMDGWDSRAMAYPMAVHHNNKLFLFYNGNDYGKEGIGLAVKEVSCQEEEI